MSHDMSIDGPGSPISIKKFLASDRYNPSDHPCVLIDNSSIGFAHDDPNTIYMTTEDIQHQANWYRQNVFDGKLVPAYLYRYLHFMYIDGDMKYKTNGDLVAAFNNKEITADSPDFKQIINLIKYCDSNTEAAQLIGFITLFAGTIQDAKKHNKPIRLFLKSPDNNLHPQRAVRWMSMFYKLKKEYGVLFNEDDYVEGKG
jgi:hypothetical protein